MSEECEALEQTLILIFFITPTLILTLKLNSRKKMSFDFQNLEIYKKAKVFHIGCKKIIESHKLTSYSNNQLGRASLSVALNIAEGAGKFSKADRRNFFITARASVYECVAILDILHDELTITDEIFELHLKSADELSRILFAMIKNLEQ